MPAEGIRLSPGAEIFHPGGKVSDLVGFSDGLGVFCSVSPLQLALHPYLTVEYLHIPSSLICC